MNKVDLIGYDEEAFTVIAKEFTAHATSLGYAERAVLAIPVSALHGDNVATRSENTPWYQGPTLLEHLETVPVTDDPHRAAFRFPVQYVIRPRTPEYPDYRGYAGRSSASYVRGRGRRVARATQQRRTHHPFRPSRPARACP